MLDQSALEGFVLLKSTAYPHKSHGPGMILPPTHFPLYAAENSHRPNLAPVVAESANMVIVRKVALILIARNPTARIWVHPNRAPIHE